MQPRINFFKENPNVIKLLSSIDEDLSGSSLGIELIELIKLRVSQINGCAYCVDTHSTALLKLGTAQRKLNLLMVWREAPVYSKKEKIALQLAELVTLVSNSEISDDIWHDVKLCFTDKEVVDLILVINSVNTWNRLAISFKKIPV